MTVAVTVRFVRLMPGGGYRIAVRDEAAKMTDYLWLHTRNQWLAALCERVEVAPMRPTVTITYDPETRELQGLETA